MTSESLVKKTLRWTPGTEDGLIVKIIFSEHWFPSSVKDYISFFDVFRFFFWLIHTPNCQRLTSFLRSLFWPHSSEGRVSNFRSNISNNPDLDFSLMDFLESYLDKIASFSIIFSSIWFYFLMSSEETRLSDESVVSVYCKLMSFILHIPSVFLVYYFDLIPQCSVISFHC